MTTPYSASTVSTGAINQQKRPPLPTMLLTEYKDSDEINKSTRVIEPNLNITVNKYVFKKQNLEPDEGKPIETVEDTYLKSLKEHQLRIKNLEEKCSAHTLENAVYSGKARPRYFRSRMYNIAYCKVPKCGSTFWTRLFTVLDNGIEEAKEFMKLSRAAIHSRRHTFNDYVRNVIQLQSPSILSSRNPYSRLFSAFIDKSYLPLMYEINYAIKGKSSKIRGKSTCPGRVTFQDFLHWIVRSARRGMSLNRHWAPIFTLCKPCKVKPLAILHQETFAQDVDFITKYMSVEKEKYDFIRNTLQGHRDEVSLPSIIGTILERAETPSRLRCLGGWDGVMRRVWNSLVIQGFISVNAEYPSGVFAAMNDPSDGHEASEIILSVIAKHPMTSEEKHTQRNEALKAAYAKVDDKTINAIKQLYREDFELFGYSNVPPHLV